MAQMRKTFSDIDEAAREGLTAWPRIADRVAFVRECIKLHRESSGQESEVRSLREALAAAQKEREAVIDVVERYSPVADEDLPAAVQLMSDLIAEREYDAKCWKERAAASESSARSLREERPTAQAIPKAEWHEDFGPVLWWNEEQGEPPYVGRADDEDFDDEFYTHFTRIANPVFPAAASLSPSPASPPCPHEAAEQNFGEKDWRCIKCGAVVTLPRNA